MSPSVPALKKLGMTHQPSRRTQHPSSLLPAGLLQLRPSCGRAGPGTVPLLFTSVQASASLCMQTPPQLSTPWSEAVPPQSTKFVMEGLGTGSPLRHSVTKRVPTYQNPSFLQRFAIAGRSDFPSFARPPLLLPIRTTKNGLKRQAGRKEIVAAAGPAS